MLKIEYNEGSEPCGMVRVHSGGVQFYKARKPRAEALAELKKKMLDYLSKEERFSIVRSEGLDGMLILEEGRGVVESWSWRKVEFLQRLVKAKEINEARENHKKDLFVNAAEYLVIFNPDVEVGVKGIEFEHPTQFKRFIGDFRQKSEIITLVTVEMVLIEKTFIVWTEDLI